MTQRKIVVCDRCGVESEMIYRKDSYDRWVLPADWQSLNLNGSYLELCSQCAREVQVFVEQKIN